MARSNAPTLNTSGDSVKSAAPLESKSPTQAQPTRVSTPANQVPSSPSRGATDQNVISAMVESPSQESDDVIVSQNSKQPRAATPLTAQIRRSDSAGRREVATEKVSNSGICAPDERTTTSTECQTSCNKHELDEKSPQKPKEDSQTVQSPQDEQQQPPSTPPFQPPPVPQVQQKHQQDRPHQQQAKLKKHHASDQGVKRQQEHSSSLLDSTRSSRGKQKKNQKDDANNKRSRQQRAIDAEPSASASGDKESTLSQPQMVIKDTGREDESSVKAIEPLDSNKPQAHQDKRSATASKRDNNERTSAAKSSEPKSSSPSSKAKDSPVSESLDQQSQKSSGNKQFESTQSSAKQLNQHATKMTNTSPPNRVQNHHHNNNSNHHYHNNHNHHHQHHGNNQQQSIKVSNLLKQCRNKFVTNMGKLVQNSLSSYSDTKFAGLLLIMFTMFAMLLAIFIHYYIIAPVNGS